MAYILQKLHILNGLAYSKRKKETLTLVKQFLRVDIKQTIVGYINGATGYKLRETTSKFL